MLVHVGLCLVNRPVSSVCSEYESRLGIGSRLRLHCVCVNRLYLYSIYNYCLQRVQYTCYTYRLHMQREGYIGSANTHTRARAHTHARTHAHTQSVGMVIRNGYLWVFRNECLGVGIRQWVLEWVFQDGHFDNKNPVTGILE